jgi:hypothetical protein
MIMTIKKCFIISLLLILCLSEVTVAGIVITSKRARSSETSIYQKGIAIYLIDGKASSIVDTNTNNCIAINHNVKRYVFLKCSQFKVLVKKLDQIKQKEFNEKIPLAVQELMAENQPPKTPIQIKRSGRGSYQGFHVEKYQFVVDDEVVSEYWMSKSLKEKITKEIDVNKLDTIFNKNLRSKKFKDGLYSKINEKYNEFKKNRYALKEFQYTGSETKKIYRHVTMRRVKIRKYMPPQSYTISSSIKEFLRDDAEL